MNVYHSNINSQRLLEYQQLEKHSEKNREKIKGSIISSAS